MTGTMFAWNMALPAPAADEINLHDYTCTLQWRPPKLWLLKSLAIWLSIQEVVQSNTKIKKQDLR